MRTTCPKCKKGALIVVKRYSETVTTVENIEGVKWGFFDADGSIDFEDAEELERETESSDCVPDDDDGAQYVQCRKCQFVVEGHPLQANCSAQDLAEASKEHRKHRVKHPGATVVAFDEAQQQVLKK